MRSYATAQLIGDRSHQCDATAVYTAPTGARAYVDKAALASRLGLRRNQAILLAQSVGYPGT